MLFFFFVFSLELALIFDFFLGDLVILVVDFWSMTFIFLAFFVFLLFVFMIVNFCTKCHLFWLRNHTALIMVV